MPRNKIGDLRNHLFEALERLKDEEDPEKLEVELKRAKAVASLGQTIINSATVEVQFLEATGARQDGQFFDETRPERQLEAGRVTTMPSSRVV